MRDRDHAKQRNYSIAVDFDGVIHSYTSPWIDAATVPDPPVPGAIEWMNEMAKKFEIIIFTTRAKAPEGREAVFRYLRQYGYVGEPSDERLAEHLITAVKPPALIYLDDRAVRFDGKRFPTADEIHRKYVPWNKRRAGDEAPRTTLADDEVWDLRDSLAHLIADGLERLAAEGKSMPISQDAEAWDKKLRDAAVDFRASVASEDVPLEGLAFLRAWWRDLWD